MTGKVYIIVYGNDSNYRIVGVFKTKEDAIKFAETYNFNMDDIEEWNVYGAEDLLNLENKKYFQISMDKNGDINWISETTTKESLKLFKDKFLYLNLKSYHDRQNSDREYDVEIMVRCWAFDEKHAIDIANESRTQFIISGEWAKFEEDTKNKKFGESFCIKG
jgi:hypothetical protein